MPEPTQPSGRLVMKFRLPVQLSEADMRDLRMKKVEFTNEISRLQASIQSLKMLNDVENDRAIRVCPANPPLSLFPLGSPQQRNCGPNEQGRREEVGAEKNRRSTPPFISLLITFAPESNFNFCLQNARGEGLF